MIIDTPKTSQPPKNSLICDELRNDIIDGKIALGSKLPTQLEMVERFQVSPVTVQRALRRLRGAGFIRTDGRKGTYVTLHPPHLCHYGVVFRDGDSYLSRSRYHEMIEQQVLRLQRAGDRKITLFHGINGFNNSYEPVISLVRENQMAGLILIDGDSFAGSPLLNEPGIHRVAIMSRKVAPFGCPIIYPDMLGMIEQTLDTLQKTGRRNLAVLSTGAVYEETGAFLRHAIRARGFNLPERWFQIIPHEIPQAARHCVLMLMAPLADRPDALFIVDDNLVDAAMAGLVQAGVQVPDEMHVIAHCNFPWSAPSVIPIQRIGFSSQDILKAAISTIDEQRNGRPVPAIRCVHPLLEPTPKYPT